MATGLNLKSGNTKSCGCLKNRPQNVNIQRQTFNKLTAIKRVFIKPNVTHWECNCECGNTTVVNYVHLITGHTKSCGCSRSQNSSERARYNLAGRQKTKHPRWRFDLSDEERQKKRTPEDKEWSEAILRRDQYKCRVCGKQGALEAHHLDGYANHPEQRRNLSNGICLCRNCHKQFHSAKGLKVTAQDFYDYFGL